MTASAIQAGARDLAITGEAWRYHANSLAWVGGMATREDRIVDVDAGLGMVAISASR